MSLFFSEQSWRPCCENVSSTWKCFISPDPCTRLNPTVLWGLFTVNSFMHCNEVIESLSEFTINHSIHRIVHQLKYGDYSEPIK